MPVSAVLSPVREHLWLSLTHISAHLLTYEQSCESLTRSDTADDHLRYTPDICRASAGQVCLLKKLSGGLRMLEHRKKKKKKLIDSQSLPQILSWRCSNPPKGSKGSSGDLPWCGSSRVCLTWWYVNEAPPYNSSNPRRESHHRASNLFVFICNSN